MFKKLGMGFISLFFCFLFNNTFADTSPKFVCTLTDKVGADSAPIGQKDTFNKDTPMIYLVCQSDQVKKGDVAKAAWIAADTNNVAPANYKIDESSFKVEKDATSDQIWTVKYSLSKPNAGWPVGKYHVDLYLGDKLIMSEPFTIK